MHLANIGNQGEVFANEDFVVVDIPGHDLQHIANTLADIFTASKRKNLATNIIADDMAAARFQFSYAQAS